MNGLCKTKNNRLFWIKDGLTWYLEMGGDFKSVYLRGRKPTWSLDSDTLNSKLYLPSELWDNERTYDEP